MSTSQRAELDGLRAQVARLQAEKNDLVALNSELQLKADQDSQDDGSFIEIIRVSVQHTTTHTFNNTAFHLGHYRFIRIIICSQDGGVDGLSETCGSDHVKRPDLSITTSRHDTEEATVSQLLQSLRNETQRAESLQAELKSSKDR